jgi:CHASE2 domain-containing sensor protein
VTEPKHRPSTTGRAALVWARRIARLPALARTMTGRVRARWHAMSHRNKHWLINIAIGVVIETLLYVAETNGVVAGMQNWAMDAAMRRNAATDTSRAANVPVVTVIDVDEETWRSPEWGNGPSRAPRQPLFDLIAYAVHSGAQSVVVDVIVEAPDNQEDARFSDDIRDLSAHLAPNQHIFFVKTARRPLVFPDRLAPAWQTSVLDQVVAESGGKLSYAAPYFQVSTDGLVRNWLLWRSGCSERLSGSSEAGTSGESGLGRWKTVPSVQLAVYGMVRGRDIEPHQERAGVCVFGPQAIAHASDPAPDKQWFEHTARVFDCELESAHETSGAPDPSRFDLSSRIFYKDAFPPASPRVGVLSALAVLQRDRHIRAPSPGGVVVIGQSSDAVRDWHATPLGAMPGPMILANAIESLLEYGPIDEPPQPYVLLSTAALIVGVGFVFAVTDSWIGSLVILITFVPLLILLNGLLLRGGYWFEFSVPLLGMYAHKVISNFEEYLLFRKWRRSHASDHSNPHGDH